MIDDPFFYVETPAVYPPFKKGRYLEEFFWDACQRKGVTHNADGRRYIPAFWTNFQIDPAFPSKKLSMQESLDRFISVHPCDNGYFTVVQHDDGPLLSLPADTIVYGACTGDIALPLIYEDTSQKLIRLYGERNRTFSERSILCSFVGTDTHSVRTACIHALRGRPGMDFTVRPAWSIQVDTASQDVFIQKTLDSKFALAPRGYGRSSFRFFEIFQLGAIPVYVWDDIEWLPYKDQVDYSKICISIHVSQIESLPHLLNEVTVDRYNTMRSEYERIRDWFSLETMTSYVLETSLGTIHHRLSLCIPTMDRFDSFLGASLDRYLSFLEAGWIDEIVICDENGTDYEKIFTRYGLLIGDNDQNFRVYKNPEILGVFRNKIEVCRRARHDTIILLDSDNFAEKEYFVRVRAFLQLYLATPSRNHPLIISPSVLLSTSLRFQEYSHLPITRQNVRDFLHLDNFWILLNTGNYALSKSLVHNVHYENDNIQRASFYDVVYFNLLVFRQFPTVHLHVLSNLEYHHRVHPDSGWLKLHHMGDDFYHNVIRPGWKSLSS